MTERIEATVTESMAPTGCGFLAPGVVDVILLAAAAADRPAADATGLVV